MPPATQQLAVLSLIELFVVAISPLPLLSIPPPSNSALLLSIEVFIIVTDPLVFNKNTAGSPNSGNVAGYSTVH